MGTSILAVAVGCLAFILRLRPWQTGFPKRLRASLGTGFVVIAGAWLVVFCWNALKIVYGEHVGNVTLIAKLAKDLDASKAAESKANREHQTEIETLHQRIRELEGANRTTAQTKIGSGRSVAAANVLNAISFPSPVQIKSGAQSLLETTFADQMPRVVFDTLVQYDDLTITNIPKAGESLRDFKRDYYRLRGDLAAFERDVLDNIGSNVTVRFREGWAIYYQYALMRFGGMSKEQIIAKGDFLNYEITWDDAERVFGRLSQDTNVSARLLQLSSRWREFQKQLNQIKATL
jgi:hypothetical protein